MNGFWWNFFGGLETRDQLIRIWWQSVLCFNFFTPWCIFNRIAVVYCSTVILANGITQTSRILILYYYSPGGSTSLCRGMCSTKYFLVVMKFRNKLFAPYEWTCKCCLSLLLQLTIVDVATALNVVHSCAFLLQKGRVFQCQRFYQRPQHCCSHPCIRESCMFSCFLADFFCKCLIKEVCLTMHQYRRGIKLNWNGTSWRFLAFAPPYLQWCDIESQLLLITSRKSFDSFQLLLTSTANEHFQNWLHNIARCLISLH